MTYFNYKEMSSVISRYEENGWGIIRAHENGHNLVTKVVARKQNIVRLLGYYVEHEDAARGIKHSARVGA